ncbi:MAG: hypothetical protein CMM77_10920 [Rhodospirillaceae bacterium]|nr:hypothetical protein [Magnetovibrio sp.]MAY67630.1 hypothetical protein [Rhodospirillaceae bacterium]
MPDQTDTRARLQAILDAAADHLERGNTRAYWKTIERISPVYARVAGQVANREGPLGTGARERLQDAAENGLKRRLSEADIDRIEIEIATRDHDTRQKNLAGEGWAGVTLRQTGDYHSATFKGFGLPSNTYTLHPVIAALGPVANAWRDTDRRDDPAAKARFDDAIKRHKMSLGEGLRHWFDIGVNNLSFISDVVEGYAHNFQDWSEERRRKFQTLFENGDASGAMDHGPHAGKFFDRAGVVADLTRQDDPLEDVLLKRPGDLTDAEVRAVMGRRLDSRDDGEREALFRIEKARFDHIYGTAPARRDATGRLIQPEPVNSANANPSPARGPDGRPMAETLSAVAEQVADLAQGGDRLDAVRALQRGLNVLIREPWRTPDFNPEVWRERLRRSGREEPSSLFAGSQPLKDDGLPGPETRAALRRAAAAWGRPGVEEGLALGRFDGFVRNAEAGGLRTAAETAFAPLFPAGTARPGRPRPEGYGLQMAVNDLGQEMMGGTYRPLKEDGDIGPKTEAAFHDVLRAAGPDRLISRLGKRLGFFGAAGDTADVA